MDWREILKTNVTHAGELEDIMHLHGEHEQEVERILERFPMSVPRYYLSLIDWNNPKDPIRRMCIPSLEENDMTGKFDTSGEAENTRLPGLQHKYGETALILSTHRCAMYCRHCFRKRLVGISEEETADNFEKAADYIREHKEISNVLISGGDALLNSNEALEHFLDVLSSMEQLDFLRIGTRTPVTFPFRITMDPELVELLKRYDRKKKIYVVTQFNHSAEITEESEKAVRMLLDAGISVKNQTVLLRGVNDDPDVLGGLLKGLTAIGVIPYYIFQCRPVSGVGTHFQVPILKGAEIVERAKQMQNGFGKGFKYVMSHRTGKIEILGVWEDGRMLFKYHQAKYDADRGRIFAVKLGENQTWLPDGLCGAGEV